MKVFVGALVHATWSQPLFILQDKVIGVDGTKITFLEESSKLETLQTKHGFSEGDITRLQHGEFLCPGLVDTHIHASQYVNAGKGLDMPLLDWLKTYTFPEEAKFRDPEYAARVYKKAVTKTLRNGTTTACYFATIHKEGTLILCKAVGASGQRAYVGKVCMNQNCPDYYKEPLVESLEDTDQFVKSVQDMKNPLITPVITPRFAPTSDKAQLHGLGQLAQQHNLPIQSHISENKAEVEWVRELFPDSQSYTDVYLQNGLLTSKTVMAHGVYLSDEELATFRETGAGISHCPNSNVSIHSGLCDVRRLLNNGVKVGLGTDVSGGYHPSILNALRLATAVSNVLSLEKESYNVIDYKEAFRLATLGGSQVLGLDGTIGNFEVGKDFDALRINLTVPDSPVDIFEGEKLEEIVQKFLYLGDDRNITEVYVAGRRVVDRTEP